MKQLSRRAAIPSARGSGDDRLRILLDTVPDYAIFMIGPQGMVLTWNEGAAKIKGYTAEEIIGQRFSIFYPLETVAAGQPRGELDRAVSSGRHEVEGWRVRKDGSRFWANVVITPIRDLEGRLRGFGVVTRDLTDRLRLQRSEARLRATLDAFAGALAVATEPAVIVTGPDGRITFFNRGAELILGHARSSVLGQNRSVLHDPLELGELADQLGLPPEHDPVADYLQLAAGGPARHWTYIAAGGGRRAVSVTVTAVGDPYQPGGYLETISAR
jgi:PAS domain S-box-containing protein